MRVGRGSVAVRFRDHLRARGLLEDGDGVVVALSGGADSVALLHLLRFTAGLPGVRVVAAHVDHRMRDGSEGDALWVRGLCAAWGVPLFHRVLDPAPTTEAEARAQRYQILEEVRLEAEARWVVTAHHADDQAETVLFRAVRGTGVAGLQGIRERRPPAVWRPLLPFSRDELRRYAREQRLGWRDDPTNLHPLARNVLRHRVLPALEADVAPSARKALAGLARRARWDEAGWRSLEPLLRSQAGVSECQRGYTVDRGGLRTLHPSVRGRLLRSLARRLGRFMTEAGTRRAVEFTSSGESGGCVPLGGGLTLCRELDRFVLERDGRPTADREITVDAGLTGCAPVVVGGVSYRVHWRTGRPGPGPDEESFAPGGLTLPLTVRGWRPGDRIRLAYGSKKLKKLLLEARVPSGQRRRMPLVVDAAGSVLWVPGVARAAEAFPKEEEEDDVLTIGIQHAHPY